MAVFVVEVASRNNGWFEAMMCRQPDHTDGLRKCVTSPGWLPEDMGCVPKSMRPAFKTHSSAIKRRVLLPLPSATATAATAVASCACYCAEILPP